MRKGDCNFFPSFMTAISGWELRVRTVGIGNWESGLWELGLGIWDFRLRSSWKESSCGGNLDYFRSSHATSARIGILECGNWELGIWTVETERELGIGDPDSIFIWFVRLEARATKVPPATAHQKRPMLPCDFRPPCLQGTGRVRWSLYS